MRTEPMLDMFAYDRWATLRTLGSLSQVGHDAYLKDMGSSHGGIHGTLVHLLAADRVWLDRWVGVEYPSFPTVDDYPGLDSVREAIEVVHSETDAFLSGLTDERLQGSFVYTDMHGRQYGEILWYSMIHKVNHATYHRGQIVTLLRQLGENPVGTDLIIWRRSSTSEGAS